MKLHLEPVTAVNRAAVLALAPAPGQEGFLESTADCLAEADSYFRWRPVGIYDEKVLVGFAMYGFFPQYFPFGRVWLDRLLIDRRYQGQGYGRAAMSLLLERLKEEYPHRRKTYLSVVEGNLAAEMLYRSFGFSYTGERDIHGERVMVRKRKN